jgi:elongator complex protein 3
LKEGALVEPDRLEMVATEYDASDGQEFFISTEDSAADILVGYVRLRIPSQHASRNEVDGSTALVRELHVYGTEVPVGQRRSGAWQHAGFGRKLLAEAERKAREAGRSRILVLSALGTKQYYERLGYSHVGPYMGKTIN